MCLNTASTAVCVYTYIIVYLVFFITGIVIVMQAENLLLDANANVKLAGEWETTVCGYGSS